MNKLRYILVFILFLLTGCSKTVKHNLSDVESGDNNDDTALISDQNINPIAFEHFLKALSYEENNEYQKAADLYLLALQYHPESYEIRYSLASVNYKLGKYPLVIEILKSIHPVDENVILLRAASFMSMGKTSESINNYHKLLELNPDNLTAYINLSGYYRRTRNIDSLIWIYENLTRLRPYISSNWRELGTLQARKGDFEKAKQSLQESIAVEGGVDNIISYLNLAEIYLLLKDEDSALELYQQSHEIDPYNTTANKELSLYYVRAGDFETALPYAKTLSELRPDDFDAGRRLALIYYGLDSLLVSDSVFTNLINSGDNNFLNHYYLGLIAIQRKEYLIARDEFEMVTKMQDTLLSSWLNLGYTYRNLNDFKKEQNSYLEGLKYIKDEKGILKIKMSLGSSYEQSGKYDLAVKIFKEIIDFDPNNAQALNYLGYMWADKGENLDEAKLLIERALEIEPENAAYIDSYGWIFYRLGNFKEALRYLKKAGENSDDPIIYNHLGDTFNALGDKENANIWWNKALEKEKEIELIKGKLKHE